jgi:hypothetical protein
MAGERGGARHWQAAGRSGGKDHGRFDLLRGEGAAVLDVRERAASALVVVYVVHSAVDPGGVSPGPSALGSVCTSSFA